MRQVHFVELSFTHGHDAAAEAAVDAIDVVE
jgi:hypothetical protein